MSLPKSLLRPAFVIGTSLSFAVSALAQCPGGYGNPIPSGPAGGSYGGPGDVTPPAGPSGPTTPRPNGPAPGAPSTGGPSAPTTGAPLRPAGAAPAPSTGGARGPSAGVPGAAAGPTTGPRGAPIGEDLTTWQYWWQFNQDGHLRNVSNGDASTGLDDFYLGPTRRAATVAMPAHNRTMTVDRIVPALQRAVEVGPREVTAAGMMALARIAAEQPAATVYDLIQRRLADGDQTVRETAALALGLAGRSDDRCTDLLLGVLRDDAAGRQAVGSAVDDRTRAFAAYGLGLLANGTSAVDTKRRVFEALRTVIAERDDRGRELRVAAVHAIGLLDIDQHKYAGARLAREVLTCLDEYYTADLGVGEQQAQAHCPTAIARLLDGDQVLAERYKELFAGVLEGRGVDGRQRPKRRVGHPIAQSCALALGQLCAANDDGDEAANPDVRFSKVLLDAWQDHKDAQTRSFSLLALGQIGGEENRKVLLRELRRASANIEQPWCALALGLYAKELHDRTGAADLLIGDALLRKFRVSKNPEAAGALAIALGLARYEMAGELMTSRLLHSRNQEALAAALCQGLSLLGTVRAREDLGTVLADCDRQPQVLEQAAIALGRLGDRDIGDQLVSRLTDGEPNYSMQVALATALADVGRQQQLDPLLAVLDDTSRSAITRAGAARAIGGIVARSPLRWNTPLRANANYRANVASLTDSFAGVLDLR